MHLLLGFHGKCGFSICGPQMLMVRWIEICLSPKF